MDGGDRTPGQAQQEHVDPPHGPPLTPRTRPSVLPPPAPASDPPATVEDSQRAPADAPSDATKEGGDDRPSRPLVRFSPAPCCAQRLPSDRRPARDQLTRGAFDFLLEQTHLSILRWNPSPRRHRPNNVEMLIVVVARGCAARSRHLHVLHSVARTVPHLSVPALCSLVEEDTFQEDVETFTSLPPVSGLVSTTTA